MSVRELGHGPVKKITWEWTSDALGAASIETAKQYNGVIERLVTIPGTAGDQPDDNYDVTIEDEDGVDVLMGEGVDRHESNTQQVGRDDLGVVAYSTLTLVVADAGATNKGTVHLYIR